MDNSLARELIYIAFDHHIRDGHNADFEMCDDPRCQKAAAAERTLNAKKPTRREQEAAALARDLAAQREFADFNDLE